MKTATASATEISFIIGKEDGEIAQRIVERAIAMGIYRRKEWIDALMDLRATHANGNPLDFAKLEGFDDVNFAHDVGGIRCHMDRLTGKLQNFFVPRCSKPS